MQQPHPSISVVLPVYNEEPNIGPLIRALARVLDTTIRQPYEIIVVDDASTDGSAAAAMKAAQGIGTPAAVSILTSVSRLGQSAALMRGMEAAAGSIIVTMDADGQHDPAEIPELLAALHENDLVCGVRNNRQDGFARARCSKIANAFRNMVTGDATSDSGCTFRALRRECVPALRPLTGRLFGCEFFFHPLTLRYHGFNVAECTIEHRKRGDGSSKYHLFRGRFVKGFLACCRAKRVIRESVSPI